MAGQARSYEEIMANNGSIGSHMNQPKQESELDQALKMGASVLKTGWSYFSKTASVVKQKADETGVTSTLSSAAATAKAKADEVGVTDVMKKAGKNVKQGASMAVDYTVESSKSIYSSA